MCGICGFVGRGEELGSREVVDAMSASLTHRGPDESGRLAVGATGDPTINGWLGHRRLRIIDLSAAAAQPMCSDDGSVALTYNGEIYNFRRLRSELEAKGHRLRSSGDTEVVLRAYLEWGDRVVERLDGMFALAIWDARAGRLLLARDRTGKKPLFYCEADGSIVFASEIKAIARAPWVRLEPALERIPAFLAHGYIPWPETFYRSVRQVPPGAVASYDARSGALEVRAYWAPPLRPSGDRPAPQAIAAELERATTDRMVADVPLGAFLSGGMDSSVVVALMARASSEPVRTFSAGFPDDRSFDERPWAERVARHLGTRHTSFAVRADAVGLLDRLIWMHDGPFGDSSAIPTYLISQLAAEHVRVVLSGDGGDEVFAGYDRFVAARVAAAVPSPVSRPARAVAGRLPAGTSYANPVVRLRRFLASTDRPLLERYAGWVSVFGPDALAQALGGDGETLFASATERFRATAAELESGDAVDRIVHANLRTYLADDLNVKVDRMAMAHSLEVRSPFLDTRVLELLASVRATRRIGLRQVKPLLRGALEPLLPAEIWRRRKHGFGVPVGAWFQGELGEVFQEEVLGADSRVRDVLAGDGLAAMFEEHRAGRANHGGRLWTLLTLERWLRSCATGETLAEPAPARLKAEQREVLR
jgi:asparagine synthase (glutamine-hydrolysing)